MNFKSFVFAGFSLPLLVPAAAFSQDVPPACLAGHTAAWIGGSPETATLAGEARQTEVSFGSGGRNIAAFRVSGDERPVRVELGAQTNGDPYLTLLNANGQTLAEGDDYEGTLATRLEQPLTPGDYCLMARDVSNGPLTATLRVSEVSEDPIVLPGGGSTPVAACTANTEATVLDATAFAAALKDHGSVTHAMGGRDGVQYYRFDLPEGANLRLTAVSAQLDPKIALYNSDGTQVAENDDTDGTNARLDMLGTLPGGTYCLATLPLSAGDGEIRVGFAGVDPAEVLRDAYRAGKIPPAADSGYAVDPLDITSTAPQVKLLGPSALWFSFEVSERQVLVFNAYSSNTGLDSRMALFDAFGRQIEENDDANGTTDPQIGPVILEPGHYRLAVAQLGTEGGAGQMRAVSLGVQRFVQPK